MKSTMTKFLQREQKRSMEDWKNQPAPRRDCVLPSKGLGEALRQDPELETRTAYRVGLKQKQTHDNDKKYRDRI
jgi:hypothetical protein